MWHDVWNTLTWLMQWCAMTHSMMWQDSSTATHCNTLQHTATHCNILQHTAIFCNTLSDRNTFIANGRCRPFAQGNWGVVVCCGVLQYVAVGCSGLQWVAVGCSGLQWAAVGCSMLKYVAVCCWPFAQGNWGDAVCCSLFKYVAVCCRDIVCCCMLQSVAVCCSVLYPFLSSHDASTRTTAVHSEIRKRFQNLYFGLIL